MTTINHHARPRATSSGTDTLADWRDRAAALADQLVELGKLRSPAWQAAITQVPRHVFVPLFYRHRDGRLLAVSVDDPDTRQEWVDHVYANDALVTTIAVTDGDTLPVFLSSSSAPGLMTRMLESLDVHDGHTVLEIGTGTGYNAALLCHRLGAGQVTSVDVEPDLVDTARVRLAELGWHPSLITGDGAVGAPEQAPFDRVIATCSVPEIPWPWIEQTRLGGVVLADVRVGMAAGNLVRLTRVSHDRAEGLFDAGQASFMSLRHHAGAHASVPYARRQHDTPADRSTTTLEPRTPWTNPVVWFLAATRLGGRYRLGYAGGDRQQGPRAVAISTPDGSRAEITIEASGDSSHTVEQTGDRRLWDEVEQAHQLWSEAGQPSWARLGLRVTPDHQTLYVEHPDQVLLELPPTR